MRIHHKRHEKSTGLASVVSPDSERGGYVYVDDIIVLQIHASHRQNTKRYWNIAPIMTKEAIAIHGYKEFKAIKSFPLYETEYKEVQKKAIDMVRKMINDRQSTT